MQSSPRFCKKVLGSLVIYKIRWCKVVHGFVRKFKVAQLYKNMQNSPQFARKCKVTELYKIMQSGPRFCEKVQGSSGV